MQKKDLRIHMIKVHGAPKPHAVSDSNANNLVGNIIMPCYWKLNKIWFFSDYGCIIGHMSRLVSAVSQVFPVPHWATSTRGSQTSWWETVCVWGVRPSGLQPQRPANAHQSHSQVNTWCEQQRTETCFIYYLDWLLIISARYSKSRLLENARIMHACGNKQCEWKKAGQKRNLFVMFICVIRFACLCLLVGFSLNCICCTSF